MAVWFRSFPSAVVERSETAARQRVVSVSSARHPLTWRDAPRDKEVPPYVHNTQLLLPISPEQREAVAVADYAYSTNQSLILGGRSLF